MGDRKNSTAIVVTSLIYRCTTLSYRLANSVDGGEQPVANVTDRANSINR